jgi:spore maturation protein CgeB
MRVVMFYHSLVSDWNHGNAHFLRGVVTELIERGHSVEVYEPADGWSRSNLLSEFGQPALDCFQAAYPKLHSRLYNAKHLDLECALNGVDLVLVHEWNDHDLVRRIGEHHRRHGEYVLFFHDTHHRAATAAGTMAAYDLKYYDGVLAFGRVIADIYLENRWAERAFVWHESADTRIFTPCCNGHYDGDLVWVGNWGDDERTRELHEFLLRPVQELGLKARVYGVRYPQHALDALKRAGIEYGGWLPNHDVPGVFGRYRMTVHVPRRPYTEALPGIPTIRPFEALACEIPLVCAPWNDSEAMFSPGRDFLVAADGKQMTQHLRDILNYPDFAKEIAAHGRQTILARHTCVHRVNELLTIYNHVRNSEFIWSEVAV